MLRGGLAGACRPSAEESLKAEFDVTHAHDAVDAALAQFICQREDGLGHGAELLVLAVHPVQFPHLVC